MRLGFHTFTSGSLEKAALRAARQGANTFQIFSSSSRAWRVRAPDAAQIKLLKAARERFDLHPLSIHVNYLINLASMDSVIRGKSIAAFRAELERAEAIGAEYLVLHPGSYRGRSVEEGIAALVLGLRDAAAGFRSQRMMVLLENTAGSGSHIGSRFEELQSIRELALELSEVPIGYCLDTCHLFAAGFDIVTAAGLKRVVREIERTLGMVNVKLIHVNDSKAPFGSHVDRHANIGQGHIGLDAFRRMLTHPKLRRKPFILETPVTHPDDDRRDLDTLKRLAASTSTKAPRVYRRS